VVKIHLTGEIRVDLSKSGARCVDLFRYRVGAMRRFSGESLFERVVLLHDAEKASSQIIRKTIERSRNRADRGARPTGENSISSEKTCGARRSTQTSTERKS